MSQYTIEIPRTVRFERNHRLKELDVQNRDKMTELSKNSLLNYVDTGKMSGQVFNKDPKERELLKKLKKGVDNKKFDSLVKKGIIK